MKLNTTYPLTQLLDAVSKASDNLYKAIEEMKQTNTHSRSFTTFDPEGMLTTSSFARVTLTHQTSPDRWEGYMETTALRDGPRIPCAVVRHHRIVLTNEDYTQVTLCEDFNKDNQ